MRKKRKIYKNSTIQGNTGQQKQNYLNTTQTRWRWNDVARILCIINICIYKKIYIRTTKQVNKRCSINNRRLYSIFCFPQKPLAWRLRIE